jgi:uncharacterized membrane protein (UPF0127 family)
MANKVGKLKIVNSNTILLSQVNWCDSFGGKLLGLMFRKSLDESEGLLMVEPRASKLNTSIHMLFMNFAIATVWLDQDLRVVDKVLAKPWRLAYVSASQQCIHLRHDPRYWTGLKLEINWPSSHE